MVRKLQVKFSKKALYNFEYYTDWYANNASEKISNKFIDIIQKAINTIEEKPYTARSAVDKPELREYVVQKFPFILSYCIKDDNTIIITSLLHAKMKR